MLHPDTDTGWSEEKLASALSAQGFSFWERPLPRYFFDIKDGPRLVEAAGVECPSDALAKLEGAIRARLVAVTEPKYRLRQLVIIDEFGRELATIPITEEEDGDQ